MMSLTVKNQETMEDKNRSWSRVRVAGVRVAGVPDGVRLSHVCVKTCAQRIEFDNRLFINKLLEL